MLGRRQPGWHAGYKELPITRRCQVKNESRPKLPRRRLFGHDHQKRSVFPWVIPLLIILAVIIFLPRLVSLFDK